MLECDISVKAISICSRESYVALLSKTQPIRTQQLPDTDTAIRLLTVINMYPTALLFQGWRALGCPCCSCAAVTGHFCFAQHAEHHFIRSLFK